MSTNLLDKVFVGAGSAISISLGVWHFSVPQAWKWYTYIDRSATELVLSIRAINAFFSLSLVLFGIVNMLLVCGDETNRYSTIILLTANCILWFTRVAFQVIYPQGSQLPGLQYGMLAVFVVVSLCYLLPLLSLLFQSAK